MLSANIRELEGAPDTFIASLIYRPPRLRWLAEPRVEMRWSDVANRIASAGKLENQIIDT